MDGGDAGGQQRFRGAQQVRLRPLRGRQPNSLRFCDEFAFPKVWQHEFKLSGAYPLPWYGVQLAGTLQAYPGNAMGEYWYFSRNRFLPSQYSRYDPRWYSDVNCVDPCTMGGTYVQSADRTRQYGTGSQGIPHALLPFETIKSLPFFTQLDLSLAKNLQRRELAVRHPVGGVQHDQCRDGAGCQRE